MGKYSKLMQKILVGEADSNIDFVSLCHLLSRLGFDQRVKGDHHIFTPGMLQRLSTCNPRGVRPSRIRSNRSETCWSPTGWGAPMSIKYELIIYWSEEDGSFLVEVPELPGCMADGETYEQVVANAQRVIEEWIATARELGRPIPEPKGRLMYA